jgi:hypothetical protein
MEISYVALIVLKHDLACAAWNIIIFADSGKLENTRRGFVSLSKNLYIHSESTFIF